MGWSKNNWKIEIPKLARQQKNQTPPLLTAIQKEFKKLDDKAEEIIQQFDATFQHHHHHHHQKPEVTATQPAIIPVALIEAIENTTQTSAELEKGSTKKHHDPAADAERAKIVQDALREAETLATAPAEQESQHVTLVQEIATAEHEVVAKVEQVEQEVKQEIAKIATVLHPHHEGTAAADREIKATEQDATDHSKKKSY